MDGGSGQDARATGGREVNREGAEGAKFLGEGFGGGREDNWMGR
jgi:hypothetical protein